MNYLIALIAFFGLVVGMFLAKITKEEVIFGRKYFRIMKRVILFLLILSFLYFVVPVTSNQHLFWGILLGFFLSIFVEDYLVIGLAMVSSFLFVQRIIFINAVLIFLYGLPYGTLYGRSFKFVIKNAFYFFVPVFLIWHFFQDYFVMSVQMIYFMTGVSCGGLFNLFIQKQ